MSFYDRLHEAAAVERENANRTTAVPTPPELIESLVVQFLKGAHGPTPPSVYAIAASQAENGVIVTLARALGAEAVEANGFAPPEDSVAYLIEKHGLLEWLADWCVALAQEAQG
jgi:hypothetical protein